MLWADIWRLLTREFWKSSSQQNPDGCDLVFCRGRSHRGADQGGEGADQGGEGAEEEGDDGGRRRYVIDARQFTDVWTAAGSCNCAVST